MAEVIFSDTLVDGETAFASDVMARLNEVVAQLNGNVDAVNLVDGAVGADQIAEAVATLLGVSTSAGGVRRGKSIIATEESTVSTGYTALTTPDRVSNIVLPTDGLIFISFRAWVKETVAGSKVGLHLDSDLLRTVDGNSIVDAEPGMTEYGLVFTDPSEASGMARFDAVPADIVGGQMAGQAVAFQAAAGTYTVEARYFANTGTVTAKNRHLRVWTASF